MAPPCSCSSTWAYVSTQFEFPERTQRDAYFVNVEWCFSGFRRASAFTCKQQQSNGIVAFVASEKCDDEDEEDNVDESGEGHTT